MPKTKPVSRGSGYIRKLLQHRSRTRPTLFQIHMQTNEDRKQIILCWSEKLPSYMPAPLTVPSDLQLYRCLRGSSQGYN